MTPKPAKEVPKTAQPAATQAPIKKPVASEAPPKKKQAVTLGTMRVQSGVEGASVKVDGELIGITPMPGPWTISPGVHKITVSAEGHGAKTMRVRIAAGRLTVVPVFTKPVVKQEAPKPVHRVVHTGAGFSLAWAGYLSAGLGLAAVGGGVFFGLTAEDHAAAARDLDRGDASNTRADLQSLVDQADQAAFRANLLYGVGGVALVSGVTMLLLASDGPLGVTVAPTHNGVAIGGRF